jgi:hypothetical protein
MPALREGYVLSTIGITSSLFSQIASSPSTANQFVTDLNQLAQDLQSGNLSAAQNDYVTLSDDAQDGATSSTATTSASGITANLLSDIADSTSSSATFVNELDQLGTDLQSGNLTAAQDDLLDLDSTAMNVASTAAASPGASSGTASATTQTSQAQTDKLIQAVIQAMEAGDDSVISSALSELASVSSSSQGASVLEQESQSYGSSSNSASSASSTSQLLQSLDAGSGNSSNSTLSLLA